MVVFKRSILPKKRVSLSATYQGNRKPNGKSQPVVVTPKNLDPNQNFQDEFKYTAPPNVKLDRLSYEDPQVSFATWVKVNTAHTSWYLVIKNPDGTIMPEQEDLTWEVISHFGNLMPESEGYNAKKGLNTLIDQALRSVIVHGETHAEVDLDDDLSPKEVIFIHPKFIDWVETENGKYKPIQMYRDDYSTQVLIDSSGRRHKAKIFESGQDSAVDLDIPTFVSSQLHPPMDSPYGVSTNMPVLHSIYARREFMVDLQSVIKRIGWPRVSMKVLQQELYDAMPEFIREGGDLSAREAWVNNRVNNIKKIIQVMQPGDVIQHPDYVDIGVIESKGHASGALNPAPMLDNYDKETAQSTKTFASVLGSDKSPDPLQIHIESMSLSAYQRTVSELFSKIFTLYFRLKGKNVTCEMHFHDLELRPKSELEPSRTQKILNDLKLVSLGSMTPVEFNVANSGTPANSTSVLDSIYNNREMFEKLQGIQEAEEIDPNADSDSPLSPGKKKVGDKDKRDSPEAVSKRGQRPSAKTSGKIKESKKGVSRTPRTK